MSDNAGPRPVVRTDYAGAGLVEEAVPESPWELVRAWVEQAHEAARERQDVPEPSAMSVATTGADGLPDVRTVLLRELAAAGPGFYTNLESAKAVQLRENPQVAAALTWPSLFRAIRFRGVATPLPRDVVAAYFSSRPWGSRVGAWSSEQSRPASSRAQVEEAYAAVAARHPDRGGADDVPLPEHWGGYRIECVSVEVWEGRPSRLHDRFRWTRPEPGRLDDGGWTRERLQP